MPISMEQWRASVGSNNAARTRAFSKRMNKYPSGSLLSKFFTYIMAHPLITSVWTGIDKGEVSESANALSMEG